MADGISKITCGKCQTTFTGWNYDGTLWMYHEHRCPEAKQVGSDLMSLDTEANKRQAESPKSAP